MPGIYSRNAFTIPQQGDEDPYGVTYFQPSEVPNVQYGSIAGGQAVRNAQAFANPGYGSSRLDRYAGDAKGFGNQSQGYEDGLQLDTEGIGNYYNTVNKLNDLSLKAEHLGFNIKKPDFRDQLQRQLFAEYQQHLQDAHTQAMTLKHGKTLQDEVRKAYIEGKVFNPDSPEYRNQGTFTDQNLANSVRTVVDPASEDFNKYNAKTYNDPAAYDIAHTRRTGLVQVEQQVIDHANTVLSSESATYDQKQAALADKHEAEQNQLRYAQPTFDQNEILNRAEKKKPAEKEAPVLTIAPNGNTTTSRAIPQHTVTASNPGGTAQDVVTHHSVWADIADKHGKTIKVFANPASYINNSTGQAQKGSPNGFTGEVMKIYNAAVSPNGAEYKPSVDTKTPEGEAKYLRESAARGAQHELFARLRVVDVAKTDKDMATMEPARKQAIESDIQAAATANGITVDQASGIQEIMAPIYAKHRMDPNKYVNEVSVPLKDVAGQIQANGGPDVSQLYNTPQFQQAQAVFEAGKPTERQTAALAAFQQKLGRVPSETEREKILTKFK